MAAVEQSHLAPSGPQLVSVSITPPHSANGKKDAPEGVPSELSDLELDAKSAAAHDDMPIKQEEVEETPKEEEDDVEPDHYYGGGKIPVFKPVSSHQLANTSCSGILISFRQWTNSMTSSHMSTRSTSMACRQELSK